MIKVKKSSLISPRAWGDLGIKYIPSRHDRHTLRLKVDQTNECFYRIMEVFYGEQNLFYLIAEIDHPSPNNESNKPCFDRVIIKGLTEESPSIQTVITFSGISFDKESDFKNLFVPRLPLYGEYVLKTIDNKIYSLHCSSVVLKDNNEFPEILIDSVRIHDNEKDIFTPWVGTTAVWPTV